MTGTDKVLTGRDLGGEKSGAAEAEAEITAEEEYYAAKKEAEAEPDVDPFELQKRREAELREAAKK